MNEKLWKLLNKHGIRNEQDLQKALKRRKPLEIGIMVSKPFDKEVKEFVANR